MEANNVDSILESIYSRSYSGKNIDKFLTDVQNKVDAAYFFIDDETMSNWQSENDISVKKLALSLHSSYIPILFKDSEDFFKDTTSGYIYTSDGGNLILMLYDQFIGELNDEEFIEFTFEHEKGIWFIVQGMRLSQIHMHLRVLDITEKNVIRYIN